MPVNEDNVTPILKLSKPGPRPRGRPKGSKNGVNAGHVGRPRKDGLPPKKRTIVACRFGLIHISNFPLLITLLC